MDLATVFGLLAGFGIIGAAIMIGGPMGLFFDVPSVFIVVGGTAAATFIRFPMSSVLNALKVAVNAFISQTNHPGQLIATAVELSAIVRKEGLLSLEHQEVQDAFLAKGLRLCVDGHPPEFVRNLLTQDLKLTLRRHELGRRVWLAIGDAAPAMGMVGTLVGLVQMLANMAEPGKIGPAMAVALLTTLYGALLANLVALPIAAKLEVRSEEEQTVKSLVIETVHGIQEGVNPRVMEESLRTFLPTKQRGDSGAVG